ncbi:single-stranded DNA-binding protein 3-like isoform X2 [Paramacrobiotus metropolitanus]|nr:single-stranded DNA-binding protein 3-like isoform X2 [Paramacrobiotus metropolitanus]
MFARGKAGGQAPSDQQARDKLVIYVYEYLYHQGAGNAAETFLKEIGWKVPVTPSEPPGFLQCWWCVFWDLYCAAPERRDTHMHSKEASSFHDYTTMTSQGYPFSPNMNGMGVPPGQPPHGHPHAMGEGGPGTVPSPSMHQLAGSGPDGAVPPGFFPGSHLRPSPSQMMPHGVMPMMQMSGPPPPGAMQQQQGHMPRGYAPPSNRSSPATRMSHPGQQQIEFGPPPGGMMMTSEGPVPPGMMVGRGGQGGGGPVGRGGMPASPMPPGAYGGPGGPMQRMLNPGAGSPQGGPNMMGLPPIHQTQRQPPWQQHVGPMGHYGTPSPPNGPYMGMMGPPSHMQSPSQESVLSGGSENIYGMMKGPVTDRFGNAIPDGSMGNMVPVGVDMVQSMNGEGMELKHSPSLNGQSDPSSGRNPGGMDNVVDEYGMGQFSAAAVASAASASSQE